MKNFIIGFLIVSLLIFSIIYFFVFVADTPVMYQDNYNECKYWVDKQGVYRTCDKLPKIYEVAYTTSCLLPITEDNTIPDTRECTRLHYEAINMEYFKNEGIE